MLYRAAEIAPQFIFRQCCHNSEIAQKKRQQASRVLEDGRYG